MAALIVSAVSVRECSHLLERTCLLRPELLRLTLRHFSFISRFRTRNAHLPLSHGISSVHSANCVQAKVNMWDEYHRMKSLVEGNYSYEYLYFVYCRQFYCVAKSNWRYRQRKTLCCNHLVIYIMLKYCAERVTKLLLSQYDLKVANSLRGSSFIAVISFTIKHYWAIY